MTSAKQNLNKVQTVCVFLSLDKNAYAPLFARTFWAVEEILFGDNRSCAFFVRRRRLAHFLFLGGKNSEKSFVFCWCTGADAQYGRV